MPMGLIVWDDFKSRKGAEAVAQGDMGTPKGRELEIADLFRFVRDQRITNLVWLTADVHYTAAHRYDPNRAQFQEFTPFWEFVSGPLNAGTFGPNELDATFGPEAVFVKAPARRQVQPAALGGDAVLRPGRHRRQDRRDDRAAEGPGRRHPVHAGAGAGHMTFGSGALIQISTDRPQWSDTGGTGAGTVPCNWRRCHGIDDESRRFRRARADRARTSRSRTSGRSMR